MEDKIMFNSKTKWIAHRGYTLRAFENSITAFLLASKLPFWGIETDVHQTKDGVFVIHHDENMKHTTGIDMKISLSNLSELKALTYLGTHLHIVTFREYLNICVENKKVAVIELKPFFTTTMIKELLSIIEGANYLSNCVFISFEFDNLLRLRNISKDVKIQFLTNQVDPVIIELCKEQKFDLNLDHIILSENLVNQLHNHQIQVNCWTIRNKDEAKKYIEFGVDFITTDGF